LLAGVIAMVDGDGVIKARYASSVLRVARTLETSKAVRMVKGLAADHPDLGDKPEIVDAHLAAVTSFSKLAEVLEAGAPSAVAWNNANIAVSTWLKLIE
jgi:hypothetical protein